MADFFAGFFIILGVLALIAAGFGVVFAFAVHWAIGVLAVVIWAALFSAGMCAYNADW